MSEALEQRIIKLRPHHVKVVFFSWPFVTKLAIAERHLQDGYSFRHIENMLDIYSKVIEQNSPFIIVPAIDDICASCNFNLDNALGCSRPLPQDVTSQNDLAIYLGINEGRQCNASEFIGLIIGNPASFALGGSLEQYKLMLERLKQHGGN